MREHLSSLQPTAAMFGAEYLSHAFPGVLDADRGHTGEVTVRNTSQVPWRTSGVQPGWVSLRYHWRHPDHGLVLREGDHSLLPGRVAPGTAVTLPVGIWAPADPGPYTLELDLRAEGLGWFSDHGVAPLAIPMEVRAAAAGASSARTSAQLPLTPKASGGARQGGGLIGRMRAIRHPLRAELRARNVVQIAPVRVLDTRDGSGAPGAVLGPGAVGGRVSVRLSDDRQGTAQLLLDLVAYVS